MAEEVVEADAVEEPVETETIQNEQETEVAIVPTQAPQGVIEPLDPDAVVKGMQTYQELLPKLLDASDYQDAGRDGKFVKKSGWRKIAKAFGLSVEVRSIKVERDEDGQPTRAECVARAIHPPTGQFSDADGYCSVEESRFSNPRGRGKLENDLRATATTRAKNRAISDLVGMGDVSAEEMESPGNQTPPLGIPVDPALTKKASNALAFMFGDAAESVWKEIAASCGGYMPQAAAEAIRMVARAEKERREAEAEQNQEVAGSGDDE